jgi:hypothetical protein
VGTIDGGIASKGAIRFGLLATGVLLLARQLGLDELPDWTDVVIVAVAIQAGFSYIMGSALTALLGPMDPRPGGPTHEHFSFMLYGVVVWPALALFLVSMTILSLVQ